MRYEVEREDGECEYVEAGWLLIEEGGVRFVDYPNYEPERTVAWYRIDQVRSVAEAGEDDEPGTITVTLPPSSL